MRTVTYSQARQELAALMDRVVADGEEVLVTRVGHPSVVIVSEADWSAVVETEHLLRSPANAASLRRGIDELNAGHGTIHELHEHPVAPIDETATP